MAIIPVLMYHQVHEELTVQSPLVVSSKKFRKQLEYLAFNGYYTPRVSDLLLERQPPGNGCAKRPVLITFDDGYLNMFEIAFPILMEFGFSAVVSRSADFSRNRNWWDSGRNCPAAPLMGPGHLIELDRAGIEIASHAMSHPHLPQMDDTSLRYELTESKRVLEDLIGREVPAFTYPYGEANEKIKVMVEEAGYRCAFAAYTGPINFESDLYEIRRMFMKNHSSHAYMGATLQGLSLAKQWTVSKLKGLIHQWP